MLKNQRLSRAMITISKVMMIRLSIGSGERWLNLNSAS